MKVLGICLLLFATIAAGPDNENSTDKPVNMTQSLASDDLKLYDKWLASARAYLNLRYLADMKEKHFGSHILNDQTLETEWELESKHIFKIYLSIHSSIQNNLRADKNQIWKIRSRHLRPVPSKFMQQWRFAKYNFNYLPWSYFIKCRSPADSKSRSEEEHNKIRYSNRLLQPNLWTQSTLNLIPIEISNPFSFHFLLLR